MTDVFVALGSNLGDRLANLTAAIDALASDVTILDRSPVYETDPLYDTDQPSFLNMVVRGDTSLDPLGLLVRMKTVETALGRIPSRRYGPRLIDLDILFYGDKVVDNPDLRIPHPRMAERGFVLAPLADIAPQKIHPITKRTVEEMLAALPEHGELRRHDRAAKTG